MNHSIFSITDNSHEVLIIFLYKKKTEILGKARLCIEKYNIFVYTLFLGFC